MEYLLSGPAAAACSPVAARPICHVLADSEFQECPLMLRFQPAERISGGLSPSDSAPCEGATTVEKPDIGARLRSVPSLDHCSKPLTWLCFCEKSINKDLLSISGRTSKSLEIELKVLCWL